MEQLKKKELAKELGYKATTKKTVGSLRQELAEKLQCDVNYIEDVLAATKTGELTQEETGYMEEYSAKSEEFNSNDTPEDYKQAEKEELMSFEAPCGSTFDFNPESACHNICKEEQPEVFQKCKSKFEMKQEEKSSPKKSTSKKSTKKSTSKKKYDIIGDGVGTSASMINSMLICGASLEEMESEIDVPRTRIQGHLGGLKAGNARRGPKEITRDKETGRYFIDDPDLDYYGDMNEEGVTPAQVKPLGEKVSSKKKGETKPKKKVVKKSKAKEKTTN